MMLISFGTAPKLPYSIRGVKAGTADPAGDGCQEIDDGVDCRRSNTSDFGPGIDNSRAWQNDIIYEYRYRMNNSNEERLKIAVLVDFDNIAIGVKQSLNRNFDIGIVLEAIKEKGQVITKIAYGDWKRAEDYSRAMTQHAVQMVQRNLTPGGDKNGADIALALDALEIAFTRDHINAFVIVGGDSDFIALVEKLKQYDKTVFVVGGRAFTSTILQKNCHEFISYENLIGPQSGSRRASGRAQMSGPTALKQALPLIRRALKILSDREVSPQLGLLKSTLLQLDSTFSERDYGVSSFRDFIQKLANAGHVNLKQVDRSLLVELKETLPIPPASSEPALSEITAESSPAQAAEAIRALQELLKDSKVKPHWPMYLRTFKQFLKSLEPPFDERPFGSPSTYDLVRQGHRDGLLRVERNRQGILRIFAGENFPPATQEQSIEEHVPTESITDEQDRSPLITEVLPAESVEALESTELEEEVRPESSRQAEAFSQEQAQPETVEEPQIRKTKPKRQRKTTAGRAAKSAKTTTRGSKPRKEKATKSTSTAKAIKAKRKEKEVEGTGSVDSEGAVVREAGAD
jgi:uncharacterized protein (TIGR00288 family)